MRYLWRFIRLVIFWPVLTVFYILAIICFNLLSILWYFNTDHLEGFENFWYPISTDESELVFNEDDDITNYEWISYSEYYKTPKDLLLNHRTRIYKDGTNETISE